MKKIYDNCIITTYGSVADEFAPKRVKKKTFSYVQYKAVATNYSVSEGTGKPNSFF